MPRLTIYPQGIVSIFRGQVYPHHLLLPDYISSEFSLGLLYWNFEMRESHWTLFLTSKILHVLLEAANLDPPNFTLKIDHHNTSNSQTNLYEGYAEHNHWREICGLENDRRKVYGCGHSQCMVRITQISSSAQSVQTAHEHASFQLLTQSQEKTKSIYVIYSFSRRFYAMQLAVQLYIFISVFAPWE